MTKITAVVLTLNEEKHVSRCLEALEGVVDDVLIADCYSSDATLAIAAQHNVRVVQREWDDHASQFNWALTQIGADTDWVLRMDADEYLTPTLKREIRERLPLLGREIDGVVCGLKVKFQGRVLQFGGASSVHLLRLFRAGRGRCESRWMDEHIRVEGATTRFEGAIVDENLGSLSWWTSKHNRYASREAAEMLNLEYRCISRDDAGGGHMAPQAARKRWLKETVYLRLPGGLRALAYFLYRYFLLLGFLDRRQGAVFHVLQGFWYRYLVDAKIAEVKAYMRTNSVDARTAIDRVLDIHV
jgi:glycosyltransferase involved in cell wall biosynthesis